VNNLRDLPTDIAAGKRTLATRIGDRATRLQYALFMAVAYLVPLGLSFSQPGRRPMLLPLLTLPSGIKLARRVLGGLSGRDLNLILKRTGLLLLAFGFLLSLATVLSGSR
jgi:1,4-dihydroxy-2-naphthoate polyprenyltransferase